MRCPCSSIALKTSCTGGFCPPSNPSVLSAIIPFCSFINVILFFLQLEPSGQQQGQCIDTATDDLVSELFPNSNQAALTHDIEKKRKEKFTLFSDHNGSLLRRQPRVPWYSMSQAVHVMYM